MRHHVFNIGRPYTNQWWRRNVQLGVITAGFEGQLGDRGDEILHDMDEGDWIFAFANQNGYVGAGIVEPISTYSLNAAADLPTDYESEHRHFRGVHWVYVIEELKNAIPSSEIERKSPRNTKETIQDEIAHRLLGLLAAQSVTTNSIRSSQVLEKQFLEEVRRSESNDPQARKRRLATASKLPTKVAVIGFAFIRNPDVVAEVLDRAKGTCERCNTPAPFTRRKDRTPYLEVHHRQRLADGGEDTVENAIALCPNCHRNLHYGETEA